MRRLLIAVLFCPFIVGADSVHGATEITFRLVPEGHWTEGLRDINSWATADGRVLLYQQGDVEPRLILDANRPVTVPAGSWLWTGEATGYVTVKPGQMAVPEEAPPKTLVWPVVPACELKLAAPRRWQGVERLDVVSVSYGTVHPVEPQHRQQLWIPAGSFLSYSVSQSSLYAIGQLRSCQAGQVVLQGPPALPSRERQDVLVTLEQPRDLLPSSQREQEQPIIASLQPPRAGLGGVSAPAVMVQQDQRTSVFFLDVPAGNELELRVQHPQLRTAKRPVSPLGGSARELPALQLRPRPTLTLPIDYRPLRPHQKAELQLVYCSRGEPQTEDDEKNCERRDPQPLAAGLFEYTFEGLDDGFYTLDALIDEEFLQGLGTDFAFSLRPDDLTLEPAEVQVIREMEIYGHLLIDDKPVPGVAFLQAKVDLGNQPTLDFPTDDELLYHMYFFGRVPGAYERAWLPEEVRERDPEELRGFSMRSRYHLGACAEDGTCRVFNIHSQLAGEGRMDLDLGTDLGLEVEVRDAASDQLVPGAWVLTEEHGDALLFVDHKTRWVEPRGAELLAIKTGADGIARVRNMKFGEQALAVKKPGYQNFFRMIRMPLPGNRIAVKLKPEDESGGVELRFPDGTPLASAFLLRMGEDGQQDRRCSKATDGEGRARLQAAACLQGGSVVVLHADARLTVLAAEDLARVPQLTIERAPSIPLRLRAVDSDGLPLARASVALRLGGVEIGPNELLASAGAGNGMPFYLTDERGELLLRGVDPQAPEVPAITVLSAGRRASVSVLGYRPGDVVEVVVP